MIFCLFEINNFFYFHFCVVFSKNIYFFSSNTPRANTTWTTNFTWSSQIQNNTFYNPFDSIQQDYNSTINKIVSLTTIFWLWSMFIDTKYRPTLHQNTLYLSVLVWYRSHHSQQHSDFQTIKVRSRHQSHMIWTSDLELNLHGHAINQMYYSMPNMHSSILTSSE